VLRNSASITRETDQGRWVGFYLSSKEASVDEHAEATSTRNERGLRSMWTCLR